MGQGTAALSRRRYPYRPPTGERSWGVLNPLAPPGSPARGFSRAPAYETTPDLTLEGSEAVHWRGNAVAGWIVFAENSATDQT